MYGEFLAQLMVWRVLDENINLMYSTIFELPSHLYFSASSNKRSFNHYIPHVLYYHYCHIAHRVTQNNQPIFLVYYYLSRWSYIKHTCTTYARYYFKWQTDYIFSFTHKQSFSSWCWMLPLLVISSAIKHKNHIHWHWEVCIYLITFNYQLMKHICSE